MKKAIRLLTALIVLIFALAMFVACDAVSLKDYKNTNLAELQAYADQKVQECDYSQSGLQEIAAAVAEGKAAIDNAKEKATVDTAVSTAKNKINLVVVELNYNAEILMSRSRKNNTAFKESFLDENRTYGLCYVNDNWDPKDEFSEEILWDVTSPKSRTFIIKDPNNLDDIFINPPQVDFEKEMILVALFSVRGGNFSLSIRNVRLNGAVLSIGIKKENLKNKDKDNNNDFITEYEQFIYVLKIDKLSANTAEVLFGNNSIKNDGGIGL